MSYERVSPDEKDRIKVLARFSSRAAEFLGYFLLLNEKDCKLERICEEAKEIFENLLSGDISLSEMGWYDNPKVLKYLLNNFCEPGEKPEEIRRRVVSNIEKVLKASQIDEAKDSVEYQRDKFSDLSRKIRSDYRNHETIT
jgi:hypothetical protein